MIELSYLVPEDERRNISNTIEALRQIYAIAPPAQYDSGELATPEKVLKATT